MYAVTLTAPWGSLIAVAAQRPELGKHWETRGWAPRVRLPIEIAIHQGKNLGMGMEEYAGLCRSMYFGAALHPQYPLAGIVMRDERGRRIYSDPLPRGAIVAVVTLAEVGRACLGYAGAHEVPAVRWPSGAVENAPQPELAFGDYRPGRRVWRLTQIHALAAPVPATGARGLWMLGPRAEAAVRAQLPL